MNHQLIHIDNRWEIYNLKPSQSQATIDPNVINVIEHNLAKLNERKRWQVEHLDGQRSSRSAVIPIKTGKASRESQEVW